MHRLALGTVALTTVLLGNLNCGDDDGGTVSTSSASAGSTSASTTSTTTNGSGSTTTSPTTSPTTTGLMCQDTCQTSTDCDAGEFCIYETIDGPGGCSQNSCFAQCLNSDPFLACVDDTSCCPGTVCEQPRGNCVPAGGSTGGSGTGSTG